MGGEITPSPAKGGEGKQLGNAPARRIADPRRHRSEGGARRQTLAYAILMDDVTAATMRVQQTPAPKLSAPHIFDCLDLFDLLDLTSPGRKHADRRSPHNRGRKPPKNGESLLSTNSPITFRRETMSMNHRPNRTAATRPRRP